MEKIISRINESLESVINDTIVAKENLESELKEVRSEIEIKKTEATMYRDSINEITEVISSIKDEISTLESDFEELTKKYDSKSFSELIETGTKVFNEKISDKKDELKAQTQKVQELTKNASDLKNLLGSLKEKEIGLETELKNAQVANHYYSISIKNIIDYSVEHTDDLENFKIVSDPENLETTAELVNADIDNNVDGSVFEEIDEISSGDVDDSLIENVSLDEETDDLEKTVSLDKVIDAANDLLASEEVSYVQPIEEVNIPVIAEQEEDSYIRPIGEITIDEHPEEIDNKEEQIEENDVLVDEDVTDDVDVIPTDENEDELPENTDNMISLFVDTEAIPYNEPAIDTIDVDETKSEDNWSEILDGLFEGESELEEQTALNDTVYNEEKESETILPEYELEEFNEVKLESIPEPIELEKVPEEEEEISAFDELKRELEKIDVEDTGLIVNENAFNKNTDLDRDLKECNLDIARFSDDDISKLSTSFRVEQAKEFISVLKQYQVSTNVVYTNADVILNVTPQNLNKILSILEELSADREMISDIYPVIDKINSSLLEKVVNESIDLSVIEAVSRVLPKEDYDLKTLFELNDKEYKTFKATVTEEDYYAMCLFPNIVAKNYNLLKSLGIDNLVECVTKHPHRLVYNPETFADILDKYDTDDLVRCINKNAAVIDRL